MYINNFYDKKIVCWCIGCASRKLH